MKTMTDKLDELEKARETCMTSIVVYGNGVSRDRYYKICCACIELSSAIFSLCGDTEKAKRAYQTVCKAERETLRMVASLMCPFSMKLYKTIGDMMSEACELAGESIRETC